MKSKLFRNIPNILSGYRIVVFPLILYFVWINNEVLFTIFLCVNLITDILDGLIARAFKLETEFGARLDSTADFGTYIAAFAGLFMFRHDVIQTHQLSFYLLFGMIAATYVVELIRFKRLTSFHLYSWKIGGYIQGIWFFTLFVFGFWKPYYYFMVVWGVAASVEHLIIQFMLKELRSNLKGLYWVLKEKRE